MVDETHRNVSRCRCSVFRNSEAESGNAWRVKTADRMVRACAWQNGGASGAGVMPQRDSCPCIPLRLLPLIVHPAAVITATRHIVCCRAASAAQQSSLSVPGNGTFQPPQNCPTGQILYLS